MPNKTEYGFPTAIVAIGTLGIAAIVGAGIYGSFNTASIGPEAESPDLKGETISQQVFKDGPMQTQTTISGSSLKKGWTYHASGRLIINGNIPDDTKLYINYGKVIINGDVGENVYISVNEPIKHHIEDDNPCYQYGYDFLSGKFEYSLKFHGCAKDVTDGPVYADDGEPRIQVKGNYGKITYRSQGPVEFNGELYGPS